MSSGIMRTGPKLVGPRKERRDMQKGLTEFVDVLETWASQVLTVLANTLLLPLRLVGALLE